MKNLENKKVRIIKNNQEFRLYKLDSSNSSELVNKIVPKDDLYNSYIHAFYEDDLNFFENQILNRENLLKKQEENNRKAAQKLMSIFNKHMINNNLGL